VSRSLDRRAVLAGMATAALVPHAARADDVVDLAWEDLLPENTVVIPQVFQDLIDTAEPYDSKGLFEPVHVTGMFGVSSTFTQLAEVGYALSADEIAPYA